MMPGIRRLAVFLVAIALCTASAQAAIITINLTAEITEVDDDGLFSGQINVGDIMTGSYAYDSDTPDAEPWIAVGDYWHRTSPFGVTLNIGGFVFQTDPDNVAFLIQILNDHPGYGDGYLLISYNNLPVYDEVSVSSITWQLNDYSGTAVSSDALPTTPPVLGDYPDTWVGLTMTGSEVGDGYPYRSYFIKSTVTSVELIPEPGTFLLLALGTLALRRRKTPHS